LGKFLLLFPLGTWLVLASVQLFFWVSPIRAYRLSSDLPVFPMVFSHPFPRYLYSFSPPWISSDIYDMTPSHDFLILPFPRGSGWALSPQPNKLSEILRMVARKRSFCLNFSCLSFFFRAPTQRTSLLPSILLNNKPGVFFAGSSTHLSPPTPHRNSGFLGAFPRPRRVFLPPGRAV